MPQFDFEFNNRDRELVVSQEVGTLGSGDYARLTVYSGDIIVSLANGNRAVFYSTLDTTPFNINISPFVGGLENVTMRTLGNINDSNEFLEDGSTPNPNFNQPYNDFKIFKNPDGTIYLKPNEILRSFELPQGSYNIQIDFLNQLNGFNYDRFPTYFEEFDVGGGTDDVQGNGVLDTVDVVAWQNLGRYDIATYLSNPENMSALTSNTVPDGVTPQPASYYLESVPYQFIITQISTSRKEVRIKLLDQDITRNNDLIEHLTNKFNTDIDGNITDKYQFKHILNIGTGNHIQIMNYEFDELTNGRDNQSIILKLYEPMSFRVSTLSFVTIEREVLTTQQEDIFYFSDVPSFYFGDGLQVDAQENWITTDEDLLNFQNYDNLSGSIDDLTLDTLVSSGSYEYPNLNTDFTKFENHTFFGSAKKKLENFKTKIETIQGHYSEISESLVVSCSFDSDSDYIIERRKILFNKIKDEIKTFSPYERFLYYNGQTESTASAPGLGKNYADVVPVNTGDLKEQINGGDGFDVVYHHSNYGTQMSANKWVSLFSTKYFLQDKPFFNYSGSIYLSFLLKGDSGSLVTWENRQKPHGGDHDYNDGVSFPQDTKFKENILNPNMTGSAYQRYVFHTSHSYWGPTSIVDFNLTNVSNFNPGSPQVEILNGSIKTGSSQIKDTDSVYQNYSTVITASGAPFLGAVMPAGELFRMYYRNFLSESLQGYWNIDDVESGSVLTLTEVENDAGPTFGDAVLVSGSLTVSDGVEIHGRQYGSSYFMISESQQKIAFDTTASVATETGFNFSRDDNFSMAIWVKRFHPNVANANSSDNNVQGIFNRGHTPNTYGIDYNQNGSLLRAGVRGNNFSGGGGTSHLATVVCDLSSSWNHVAFTYESGSSTGIKLYLNGVLQSSVSNLADDGFNITGSNDFSASNPTSEPDLLSIGGGDQLGGGASPNRWFNGFLQYPRIYSKTLTAEDVQQLYYQPDGISDSKITDVKITLKNPTNVQPFSNIYHTSSAEWTNWYNDSITDAENFDKENIHSFENNLPLYIQESSDYDDMKDFLNLQGEQYDLIRNHIDSMGTIHERGYKKEDSPPDNTLPMLLTNIGYEAINPFSGSLTETLGSYLTNVTTIDDIKNQTWRKILNNLLYIYKSKGTENSVRALLNTYGYPPDVLGIQEFGGTVQGEADETITPLHNESPTGNGSGGTGKDIDFINSNSNTPIGFIKKVNKVPIYSFNNYNKTNDRVFNLDWNYNNADINSIEFCYRHIETTNTQTILKSSGSGTTENGRETLWDLRLIPSSTGDSSSFQFRLNNSTTGSLNITGSAISMSTDYNDMRNGQIWNVMLQRISGSTSTDIINEYRLHAALQRDESIDIYSYVTMSVSGGLPTDSNNIANQNWFSTGSRHVDSSSNLVVGETISGSLFEIKAWSTALSTSKFRQHTFNKFSTVGNTINSHCDELVYHFKLNENYTTSSVSSSNQVLTIVDSAPTTTYSDYSFQVSANIFTGSKVYSRDFIDTIKFSTQDNSTNKNTKNIIINPKRTVYGDLSFDAKPIDSLKNPLYNKPSIKTSKKLEIFRSPQNFVDDYILNKIDGFNLEKQYGNPIHFYSQSYGEFDKFRKDFFNCHPVNVDINKFVRSHENLFNDSIIAGVKTITPLRSTLSGKDTNAGVEIKPTILEKQKYEHEKHSVEVNPNTATGSIGMVAKKEHLADTTNSGSFRYTPGISLHNSTFESIKEGTHAVSITVESSSIVLPLSTSISLGNAYSSSGLYKNPPFLQPGGFTASIVNPYSGSNVNMYNDFSSINMLSDSDLIVSGAGEVARFRKTTGLHFSGSTIVSPISGSNNFIARNYNKSFDNIHDSWGTSDSSGSDTHFINYAAGTGSKGNYNVAHIEPRFHFISIGDNEFYSASFGKSSDYGDASKFHNRVMVTNDIHKNISYESLINTDISVPKSGNNLGLQTGRMMGKTRFYRVDSDNNIDLPANHVTKFSQPFKEQMYKGAQNENPGTLNVRDYEDYSTSSFYSSTVTGGENEIRVTKNTSPTLDSSGRITYSD